MEPPRKPQRRERPGRRQAEPDLFETAVPAAHSTTPVRFAGTDNPRHLRVIHALMLRPLKREEIDQIAGASNGPDLMAELRRRGITKKARLTPGIDRDGRPVKFGIYSLDDADRRAINAWLRKRDQKAKK